MRIAALLLTALLAGSAGAQQSYPLREILIEGLRHFDRDRVIAASGLEIGAMVTADDLQRAVDRLSDAGVFETIEFRYGPKDDGYTVTFAVREVEQLYAVRFQGFDEPDEELYALLEQKVPLFSPLVPPTGVMARRIGNTLNEHWRAQGGDSDVAGRLVPIEDGRLAMLYGPEARLQNIAFVTFQGGGVISNLDLQRTFNQSAMGEPYTEARLKELLHFNVRPLYEEFGRMRVTFCPLHGRGRPEFARTSRGGHGGRRAGVPLRGSDAARCSGHGPGEDRQAISVRERQAGQHEGGSRGSGAHRGDLAQARIHARGLGTRRAGRQRSGHGRVDADCVPGSAVLVSRADDQRASTSFRSRSSASAGA